MFDASVVALSCPCYGSNVVGFAILIAVPAVFLVVGALLQHRRSTRQDDPLTSDVDIGVTREAPGAAGGRR